MEIDEALMREFVLWVDQVLRAHASVDAAAYNFNLYEHAESFAVQLAGTARFDSADPDWACDEAFSSGEDLFEIPRATVGEDWQQGLVAAKHMISHYLERGTYANRLTSSLAVCVGFVDGDIEPIFLNTN